MWDCGTEVTTMESQLSVWGAFLDCIARKEDPKREYQFCQAEEEDVRGKLRQLEFTDSF